MKELTQDIQQKMNMFLLCFVICVGIIDSFIVLENTRSTTCKYIINKTLTQREQQ